MRIWSKAFPNPRFYGWAVVGVCFLCSMLSSPGQSFALSLYLEHLIESVSLSRLELSSIYGTMTLLAAGCLPFVGGLADRYEGRHFLGGTLALLGAACLFFAETGGWIGVAFAFFALRLLGQGAIGLGTLTIVVRWFERYRSRALAVVNLGYAAGEMVFPTLIFWLIAAVGWRGSMVGFGASYLLLFAPVVWWLLRTRRDDEPFDGESPDTDAPPQAADETAHAPDDAPEFELAEVLWMPGFWVMAACVSVHPLVVTAVVFHQVALFESLGWATELVPMSFAGFAAARVVTTYLVGLWLERVSSRFGVATGMATATAALGATALPVSGPLGSMLYGCGLGMASGAISSSNSVVWPEYYGIAALGSVKGVVTAIRNASTAAGPPLVAYLAGPEEQFGPALVVLAAMSLLTAIVAPLVRPPHEHGGGD
jgi:MFS family permease